MIRQLSDQDMDSVLNVWLESRLVNGGTDLFIGMTVLSWPVSVLFQSTAAVRLDGPEDMVFRRGCRPANAVKIAANFSIACAIESMAAASALVSRTASLCPTLSNC